MCNCYFGVDNWRKLCKLIDTFVSSSVACVDFLSFVLKSYLLQREFSEFKFLKS